MANSFFGQIAVSRTRSFLVYLSVMPASFADKTTSHLTKLLKRQVIGYSHSTRLPKGGSQVAGYKRDKARRKFKRAAYLIYVLDQILVTANLKITLH
jgi:hypothetical protein